jgi:hypothetical protein
MCLTRDLCPALPCPVMSCPVMSSNAGTSRGKRGRPIDVRTRSVNEVNFEVVLSVTRSDPKCKRSRSNKCVVDLTIDEDRHYQSHINTNHPKMATAGRFIASFTARINAEHVQELHQAIDVDHTHVCVNAADFYFNNYTAGDRAACLHRKYLSAL